MSWHACCRERKLPSRRARMRRNCWSSTGARRLDHAVDEIPSHDYLRGTLRIHDRRARTPEPSAVEGITYAGSRVAPIKFDGDLRNLPTTPPGRLQAKPY